MFQQHDLNPMLAARARAISTHTSLAHQLLGPWCTEAETADPNFAGPDQVGDSRVGDLLRVDDGRNHQQSTIMSGTRRLFFMAPHFQPRRLWNTLWVRGAVCRGRLNQWLCRNRSRAKTPRPQQAWRAKGARHDDMPRVTATTATFQISRQGHTINAGIVKFLLTLSPCKGS